MAAANPLPDIPIRTVLVAQGAEYRAVKKGCQRAQAAVSVVPLPLGQAAAPRLGRWLGQYKLFAQAGYLLVGLGGGLSPDLRAGDGVLCETVQALDPLKSLDFDPELTDWLQQRLPGIARGKAVGSDRIISQATEKQQLHRQWGAAVVEMESASVCNVLQAQGLRLAMVRVISDDCRHNLPDLAAAIQPDGSLRPLALATGFMQHPMGAGRLIVGSLKGLAALEEIVFQVLR
jgi:hypothetical protein